MVVCPPGNVWHDTAMTGSPSSPRPPEWPTASILRHECADGTWHFDWLLATRQPTGPDDRCARAWRCTERPDRMRPGSTAALEALPPHRAFYLALRRVHRLDGDRGEVHPVAQGDVAHEGDSARAGAAPEGPHITVQWRDGPRVSYRISNERGGECVECVLVNSRT
ncbi:MAG: hypothetical protein JNK53_07625 [Phycisphaerae bacterium]|nr:hypothetical protein [Phycisphaerae bacterium]